MGKAEAKIQSQILKYLKDKGYQPIKVIASNANGVSDIICNVKGIFVALEVKVPGGKASELQLLFLNNIIASGGIGGVVTSVKEAKNLTDLAEKRSSYLPPLNLDLLTIDNNEVPL